MFGYKREELIGLPVDSLVPSDVRAAHPGYRAGYGQAPQARPMSERARLAGCEGRGHAPGRDQPEPGANRDGRLRARRHTRRDRGQTRR